MFVSIALVLCHISVPLKKVYCVIADKNMELCAIQRFISNPCKNTDKDLTAACEIFTYDSSFYL